jgi:hypothetical protein
LFNVNLIRTHEIEEKYYADGEDAFAMRKQLKEGSVIKKQTQKKLAEREGPSQSPILSLNPFPISRLSLPLLFC